MPHETALFWMVVAGFLFVDNLIIVPRGCELLRFDRAGFLRYDAASRLTAAGRELVLLNPLNLFDRGLVTTRCFGDVEPGQWRHGRSLLRSSLPTLNVFSLLGYVYMVLVVGLAYISFQTGFTPALIAFALLHLMVWAICLIVLITQRRALQLTGYEVFSYAAEAIFVPAYLMNLGKRLVSKRRVGISALGLGLRELKYTEDEDLRSLLGSRLKERLEVLEMTLGQEAAQVAGDAEKPKVSRTREMGVEGVDDERTNSAGAGVSISAQLTPTQQWILEAKACLMT